MNPIEEMLKKHQLANQTIVATGTEFGELYASARANIDLKLAQAIRNGNLFEERRIAKLIKDLEAEYGQLALSMDKVFDKTLEPVMLEAIQNAELDMRKSILNGIDTGKVEIVRLDAYQHVAGATTNMSKSDVAFIRQATADVMREASIAGLSRVEATNLLTAKIMSRPQEFKFIDAKGRVWNNKAYSEMLGRTVLMNARRNAYLNECAENGKDVVTIPPSGNACPNCRVWENILLSITGNTPGLPTVQDAIDGGLLHPNCTHSFAVVNDLTLKVNYNTDGTPKNGINSPGREALNDKEAWSAYRKAQYKAPKSQRSWKENTRESKFSDSIEKLKGLFKGDLPGGLQS